MGSGNTTGEESFGDLVRATRGDSAVISTTLTVGDFLIIAGTFRQEINARTRVRDLVGAGFDDTSLQIFDRGTFAVALVDRTASYNEAMELAERVRSAGYEVEVYRKR